jgi:hypothetical protein
MCLGTGKIAVIKIATGNIEEEPCPQCDGKGWI